MMKSKQLIGVLLTHLEDRMNIEQNYHNQIRIAAQINLLKFLLQESDDYNE